jgi:hypothetical protein
MTEQQPTENIEPMVDKTREPVGQTVISDTGIIWLNEVSGVSFEDYKNAVKAYGSF